ncbi:MAG: hypothetical protein JST47_10030 [Bacteroidetes bacterium]|nr:hypothetical protein [Bacteroidota bacterium]MBS1973442.1 hypothetical protein [Bacteroidota bacterium]
MKKHLAVASILFLSACASAKLIAPGQADADRGAQKFPGYTMNDLNEGKGIYEAHCNKCHKYKAPQTRDEAKWDKVIPVMARKAKLDTAQEALVLKYVVTMSTVKQ